MRRYVFYRLSAAPVSHEQMARSFHLRAADALELTRRALYREHGTYATGDDNIVENPYCSNAPGYPFTSPHFVHVSAEKNVDCTAFDIMFRERCRDRGIRIETRAEATLGDDQKTWTSVRDIILPNLDC